jgi:hypothetical protein
MGRDWIEFAARLSKQCDHDRQSNDGRTCLSFDRTRHLVQKIFCYHHSARVAFSTAAIAEEIKMETTKEVEPKEVEVQEVEVQEVEVQEVEVIELPVVQLDLIGGGNVITANF